MALTLYRLTDKVVRNLAAPGYHPDGGGLYLQISKAGAKSWVFRFTLKGKTRDMGLGSLRYVSLTEARARMVECRALVTKGDDPIEQAKAERKVEADEEPAEPPAQNFRQFAEQYIAARADTWRSSKHADQWRATLAAYAYPVIGNLPLAAIDTPDVLRIIEPLWREKSATASRLRGRIERVLAAASVRGLRPATNPAAWVGHLREALPAKQKVTSFASLPYAEVPAFLVALHQRQGVGALALEFTILTAARSGEARGARWSEINVDARIWAIPAERMKAGREHVVPLSDQALTVLAAVKPLRDLAEEYVFPGMRRGRQLTDMTLSGLVHSMGFDVVPHGFRSSFRTWAAEQTDCPREIAEAALAHSIGDKVEAAYLRTDWLEKRRDLMEAWGAFCSSRPVENVHSLRPEATAA